MERLTYVTEDGEVLFHPEDLPEDRGMTITQLAQEGRFKALEEIAERLANREQAEEQGLLLRLPCKIGCTVYEIIEESVPYHHYYIGEYQVQDVSAKAVKYCGDWTEFDSENVYFSKEEARRALKKMESEE